MRKVCIDTLQVGDKFRLCEASNYVREVRQILTGQSICDKQLLCFTNDGEDTYFSIHDCLGNEVYLIDHSTRLNELKVGDKFRWYENDKILKIVTDVSFDHIVYMYTSLGETFYAVYCAAEPTWNDEVILEDEETN